jgi:hypothetical protein
MDIKQIKAIVDKVDRQGLIRHVNGNTGDNRIANLQRVTAKEAFENKDWTVDACCILSEDEFKIWDTLRKSF